MIGSGNTGWGIRHTVTVHRPGPVDRFGDHQPGTTHQVAGCVWAPTSAGEQSPELYSRGETVTVSLTLYAPHTADIRADDQVDIPDHGRFEVIGSPRRWRNPFNANGTGCDITLRRILG